RADRSRSLPDRRLRRPPAGACRIESCPRPPRSQPKWLPKRRSAAPWPFLASCPSATARAPARARTPCEAEKTFRDPGRLFFGPAALISRLRALLAAVDKSQVFALSSIRRNIAKSPNDSIRRKFSIDGGVAVVNPHVQRPPFRNHIGSVPETRRSPSELNEAARARQNPGRGGVFRRRLQRLSVRLMSL